MINQFLQKQQLTLHMLMWSYCKGPPIATDHETS